MPTPSVLLTGAGGFLGRYLLDELRTQGVRVHTAGRQSADVALDLGEPGAVAAAVAAAPADVVLNCGALSSIGACARDPRLALAVNAEAVAAFCQAAPRVVQLSTDLVFGGDDAPYAESSAPAPRNEYGRSKAAAEAPVVAAGGLVLRLPLLFGRSFDGVRGATDMIRGAGGGSLSLFTNEFRTPLHAADAARAVVELLLAERAGIVHLPGPERVSRYEFGVRFARRVGLPLERLAPSVSSDPLRPRDVSMTGSWVASRSLDAMLDAS
ncbi:MAG: sugar nucleotide-binding protein [Planctomycetota bacterium]